MPVGPEPWAVLVVVVRTRASPWQTYVQEVGSLSHEPGGLVLMDRNGVAVSSWDRTQIGRPVLSQAEVASLPTGTAAIRTREEHGVDITHVATRLPATLLPEDLLASRKDRLLERQLRAALAGVFGELVHDVERRRIARHAHARTDAESIDRRPGCH